MGQAQSGQKGDMGPQGSPGPAGPPGTAGPQGPPGTKATWNDYSPTEKDAFLSKIHTDPIFSSKVATALKGDSVLANSIKDAMRTDLDLRNTIILALKADPEFIIAARGPTGPVGPAGGLTEETKKNILWCANGSCKTETPNNLIVSGVATANSFRVGNWAIWQDGEGRLNFTDTTATTRDKRRVIFEKDSKIRQNIGGTAWTGDVVNDKGKYNVQSLWDTESHTKGFVYLSKNNTFQGDTGAVASFRQSKAEGDRQKVSFIRV